MKTARSDRQKTKPRRPAASTQAAMLEGGAYPGGKAQIFRWIVDLLPTHWGYVDLFCGKSAVMRHKPPALESILVDDDPAVIDWWTRSQWPGVELVHGCAIDWLAQNVDALQGDQLVYCDPPYLLATRTKKRLYRRELTDAEHARLLALLNRCRCPVAISGYASPLYLEKLAGWRRFQTRAMTRGGVRIENLWTNYDPAAEAAPIRPYFGRGFRERERIKKRLRRMAGKIERLPEGEAKLLILTAMEQLRKKGAEGSRGKGARGKDGDGQLSLF